MNKASIVSTAAALLAVAGVCSAQPANVTREMIATALPLEGAPAAVPGPYEVTTEIAFGSPGHMVFYPTKLDAFPARDKLPLVVWGNGGCAIDTTGFSGFTKTVASHGFLVIGTAKQEGAAPRQATADDLLAGIAWAEKENKRQGSPLNGKIAIDQIAAMGSSCGGFMAITVGGDPRVDTIGVFNSGIRVTKPGAEPAPFPFAKDDAVGKLHGPVLLVNGHDRDFMTESSRATYDQLDRVPAFYGSRHDAGHSATFFHPGGGEFANVASNWLMWQFKNDKKAGAMFVGKSCGLCTDKNWEVESKRLPE